MCVSRVYVLCFMLMRACSRKWRQGGKRESVNQSLISKKPERERERPKKKKRKEKERKKHKERDHLEKGGLVSGIFCFFSENLFCGSWLCVCVCATNHWSSPLGVK